jgi:transposase-like protein
MTNQIITKEHALAAYGNIGSDLAKALGITPSAVYQWRDGEAIPNEQALKLRYVLKPEVFGEPAKTKAA